MIFYEVEDGSNGHYLVGTQADAKREARERKCTWAQVDIPTDKTGLMAYINQLRTGQKILDEHPMIAAPSPREVIMSATPVELDEVTNVEDFILNRATVAQVENIFACLGTRFKEMVA